MHGGNSVGLPSADPLQSPTADALALSESLVSASQPFVGRWNRLISTTNWEKGKIITEWRAALVSQGVHVTEYSDEAWSRLVGGVSGQHVGRLRRVFQRFGAVREQFAGLFWSHFQAAVEWDDAEMWLEGAKASGWSVAQMRTTRWETLGRVEADQPRPEDVVTAETDEDFETARGSEREGQPIVGEYAEVVGPKLDGPDFGDEFDAEAVNEEFESARGAETTEEVELVRPFERLPELPDDLAEAFDAMKLAILRHKTDGWRDISAIDTLRALETLKALVQAPAAA
jgi:hypothetical protein